MSQITPDLTIFRALRMHHARQRPQHYRARLVADLTTPKLRGAITDRLARLRMAATRPVMEMTAAKAPATPRMAPEAIELAFVRMRGEGPQCINPQESHAFAGASEQMILGPRESRANYAEHGRLLSHLIEP